MTSNSVSTTATIAEYIAGAQYVDLPPEIVDVAKRHILDSFGCQLGGATMPHAQIALGLVSEMGGVEESTILATGQRVPSLLAVYANGALANALDFDDCYLDIAHPAATIVPAALATAEKVGASGTDFLLAVVVGYEVSLRICDAIRPTRQRHRIGPTMATWQIFGAAAASAKLLGLDAEQARWALGHAGVSAPVPSRLKNGIYPEARPFSQIKNNFGWAAMGGTLASQLASRGLRGNRTMFDTDENFAVMAGSDQCDHDRFTSGLGSEYLMPITGIKRFGSCRQTHGTLDALLELLKQNTIEPSQVEHVLVESIIGVHRNFRVYEPAHIVDAQFSIPPLVALTIAGHPITGGIAMDRLDDPVVQDLIRKVEVGHDPEADEIFAQERHIPATVTITLTDGTVHKKFRRAPSGDPEHALTWDEVRAKYCELAGWTASAERVASVAAFVNDLENIDSVRKAVATW